MELEKLLLKKEELPIEYDDCFYVPVHPKLVDSNIKIDETIAGKVFPQVAREWYAELKEYSNNLQNNQDKEWINNGFLKDGYRIKKRYPHQYVGKSGWRDDFFTSENGFISSISVSRNAGGTLHFNIKEPDEIFVCLDGRNRYVRFPKEKIREFGHKTVELPNGTNGVKMCVFRQHNIEFYPGALFLRNWAIFCINESLRQVFK